MESEITNIKHLIWYFLFLLLLNSSFACLRCEEKHVLQQIVAIVFGVIRFSFNFQHTFDCLDRSRSQQYFQNVNSKVQSVRQNLTKRLLDTLAYILRKTRKSIHDYCMYLYRYFEISHEKTQPNLVQAQRAYFYLMIGIGQKIRARINQLLAIIMIALQHEELTRQRFKNIRVYTYFIDPS
ncbi:Hypothetical_protein [Hexamita inflata]|uniref:Hypothetical_protein n=1 Tax=Hexamita inflata TaxID=28002 RepID=A0AA86P158_9EUKA|nr:Hypothetical protein HINF_LOCUS17308 [Hexamita inflata]